MCNYVHLKALQLPDLQSRQTNQKSLRFFKFLFIKNIETFIKNNLTALEDIEEPHKIRLKKQQLLFLQSNHTKIYTQCAHRLVKENLERNSRAQSTIDQFQKLYELKISKIHPNYKQKSQKYVKKQTPFITNNKINQQNQIEEDQQQSMSKNKVFKISCKISDNYLRNNQKVIENLNQQNKHHKTIISLRRNLLSIRKKTRNYSFNNIIDNQGLEQRNQSSKYSIHTDTVQIINSVNKKQIINDNVFQSFKPFCGLSTNQIFVRKPKNQNFFNQSQKNPDYSFNFASRSLIRGNIQNNNLNCQNFAKTLRQKSETSQNKNSEQMGEFMKNKIKKISSHLAITTLEPQGYRGKSRCRYKSLHHQLKEESKPQKKSVCVLKRFLKLK